MALLDLSLRYQRRPALVVHVHHGLRSDADLDAKLVQGACDAADIPFRVLRVNVRKTNSVQQQARAARYGAIGRLCFELGIPDVVTAHHLDDEREATLAAQQDHRRHQPMPETRIMSRWGMIVHRPLLTVSREKILQYAAAHGIKWREDESNQDLRYRRAQIRAGTGQSDASAVPTNSMTAAELRWIGVDLFEFLDHRLDSLPGAVAEAFPGCDVSKAALDLIKEGLASQNKTSVHSHGVCIWLDETLVIQRNLGTSIAVTHLGPISWAGVSGQSGKWMSGVLARKRGGKRLREVFRLNKTPDWYRQVGPVCWLEETPDARPHLLQTRTLVGLNLDETDALEF
jgi:tRNA(Ile)-lysidine synthetase-like protein